MDYHLYRAKYHPNLVVPRKVYYSVVHTAKNTTYLFRPDLVGNLLKWCTSVQIELI